MTITLTTHRKAIAMIELIFAIVIMGIVMLSAPLMLTTATKSSEVAFQQESIAIIATHVNSLLTYAWDEENTEATFASRLNILSTESSTAQLDRDNTRAMIPAMARAKSTVPTVASASFIDTNDTIKDDVDDFNGFTNDLQITTYGTGTTTEENEYMDINISINTLVKYGADRASSSNFSTCTSTTGCAFSSPFTTAVTTTGTTSNIKHIISTLTSSMVSNKQIILKAFMCNIGSAKPRSNVY
jgi:Tfp pilus assembly protein PilV